MNRNMDNKTPLSCDMSVLNMHAAAFIKSVSLCVFESSRFHVVSFQDGLDGQVAHPWVFGEVTLGPEFVLQHLGKVPDVLS